MYCESVMMNFRIVSIINLNTMIIIHTIHKTENRQNNYDCDNHNYFVYSLFYVL